MDDSNTTVYLERMDAGKVTCDNDESAKSTALVFVVERDLISFIHD